MSERLSIWLVNIGEPIPNDGPGVRLLRTGILAQELADRGHDVTWFNAAVDHVRKVQRQSAPDAQANPRIILLNGRTYASNISIRRVLSHRDNARHFRKLAPSLKEPDFILAGCPTIELVNEVCRYAKARGIPFAIDFRDMWPDIFAAALPTPLQPLAPIAFHQWNRQLHRSVAEARAVTGITERFVDWGLAKARRPRGLDDQAFHLATSAAQQDASAIAEAGRFWDSHGICDHSEKVRICFAGSLTDRLEFAPVSNAMQALQPYHRERIEFLICGAGDAEEHIRGIADGTPNIRFFGWRNQAELSVLMQRCHAGLLPYRRSADFQMSYPNKLGEYLLAALPVITGLDGLTRDLLKRNDCGYFYQPEEPDSVVALLCTLAERGIGSGVMQRARKTGLQEFDGAMIYPAFADWIERLAQPE